MRRARQHRSMSDIRIGRTCRALRRRLGWRQVDLAARAGVSQPLISAIERGHVRHLSIDTLRRVLAELDAELAVSVRWRGGELERLLDEDHAALVALIVRWLRDDGWEALAEVTFSEYGERGSIDVLAWHRPSGTLLVVEVKTMVASVEEALRRLDVKVRLAPRLARARFGEEARILARLVVLTDSTTNRRRAGILRAAGGFDDRSAPRIRHWLRRPEGGIASILFVGGAGRATGGRRRVRRPESAGVRA